MQIRDYGAPGALAWREKTSYDAGVLAHIADAIFQARLAREAAEYTRAEAIRIRKRAAQAAERARTVREATRVMAQRINDVRMRSHRDDAQRARVTPGTGLLLRM